MEGITNGFIVLFSIICFFAGSFYIWLCTKWGKKWLKQL